MASASDSFTRADSSGLGANWTIPAAGFNVASNACKLAAGVDTVGFASYNATSPGSADHVVTVTITAASADGYIGPAVRCHASQVTGYAFWASSSSSSIVRLNSGAITDLGATGSGFDVGAQLRLTVSGTGATVTLLCEADTGSGFAPVTSLAAAGTILDTSGSRITAANRWGMGGYGSIDANVSADDWTAADSGGSAAALSSATPSGTLGTTTTASLGATTNQTTGTFYGVVDTAGNLSGVTATQIKAGQKASGAAAAFSGNASVSTTTPTIPITGLSAATAYSYAVVQNNANGDSNVLTGTFTTASVIPNPGVRLYGLQGPMRTIIGL